MPPDRWFVIGFCRGARERADVGAVDDALMHADPKPLIASCSQARDRGCHDQTLVLPPTG